MKPEIVDYSWKGGRWLWEAVPDGCKVESSLHMGPHVWSVWRHRKHTDKRSCSTLGCSAPGVVDLEGKFTVMAKAVVAPRKQEDHWDGFAADNLWRARCGKHAGNGLWWLAEKGWEIGSWDRDLEQLPQLSIPFSAGRCPIPGSARVWMGL